MTWETTTTSAKPLIYLVGKAKEPVLSIVTDGKVLYARDSTLLLNFSLIRKTASTFKPPSSKMDYLSSARTLA